MVRTLSDKAEFDAALVEAASRDKLLVVDFTATWCGPCQRIAPVYEALSKEYPQVAMVKVDVDENQETAQECGVSAMPTFKGYKNKREIFSVRGADEASLRQHIATHAGSKFEGQGQRLGGSAEAGSTGGSGGGTMSEREKRLAALERRGLGGTGTGGSGGGAAAISSPVGSYMDQVKALQAAQGRASPKTDSSMAAVVAAAASGSPPKLPGGTAVTAELAAKAKAEVAAQVAAAAAAAKAAADARVADAAMAKAMAVRSAPVESAALVEIGDAAAVGASGGDAGGGGAGDDEDAMLAAAIAASLQSGAEPTPAPLLAPPLAPPVPPQYTAEKEQLKAMGFADDVANQVALEGANGNVERALELLLS